VTYSTYFFLAFLAFFAFFAFFAFLAIVSSQGFNGGTRREGCSAEGQPCNILTNKLSRFAARCPALSRHCHCVIHSSSAFAVPVARESASVCRFAPSPPAAGPML